MRKVIIMAAIAGLLSSCVTQKSYNTLKAETLRMQLERDQANAKNGELEKRLKLSQENERTLFEGRENLETELQRVRNDYAVLLDKNTELESSYRKLLGDASEEASRVLRQLEQNQAELAERSQQIDELNRMLAEREEAINDIRNKVAVALNSFDGKGIDISMKDGRVLVSMEDKLLFKSGSFEIGSDGARAVRDLAKVLADNKDINILVEGHTDNVPYRPNGNLQDNLDLSAKRSTTVVRLLLENGGIAPERVTAAGRGEWIPVDEANSSEARARNRRTEIYLTPNLDKLLQIAKMQN